MFIFANRNMNIIINLLNFNNKKQKELIRIN